MSNFLHFILFFASIEAFILLANCEFAFGYHPDDFHLATINITYVDSSLTRKHERIDIGRFGHGTLKDVSGMVVHVTSNNHTSHKACDHLDLDCVPRKMYVALIQQGDCRDEVKIMHAAEGNASAVIVYGDEDNANLVKMGYRVVLLQLPFAVISKEKGHQLASLVDNGTRVFVSIGVEKRPSFRLSGADRTSVLFVSLSFISVMILSLAWLVFYYVQKFRFVVTKDILSKRLCSAARQALDKMPVKTVRPHDLQSGEVECCAVCIEQLRTNEIIRILPCRHHFHKTCVDPWLLEHRSCPMCKLDILLYFGLTYSGSQESVLEFDDSDLHRRRSSSVLQEVIHVMTSRRNSYSQTSPQMEDRGTSPCSFIQLSPYDEDHVEISVNICGAVCPDSGDSLMVYKVANDCPGNSSSLLLKSKSDENETPSDVPE